MLARITGSLLSTAIFIMGAHNFTGTWKLDTTKSKYVGMPKPKEITVTYTPEGSGWRYEAKGMREDGQPSNGSFVYVKDNEEIKTSGFPLWDTVVLKNAQGDVATGTFKRDGKIVGTVKRTVSADDKIMTLKGKVTTPDGKKAQYTSVYGERQKVGGHATFPTDSWICG